MNTEMNTTENTENIEKNPQVAKTTNKNTQPTYKHNLRAFYNLFLEKLPFLREYKPLAVGVMEQIQQAICSDQQTAAIFSKTLLRRMMAIHTNREIYLKAVINSNQRYNLDGSLADINNKGAITDYEISYSQERLKDVKERIEKARQQYELAKKEKELEQKRKQAEYFQRKKLQQQGHNNQNSNNNFKYKSKDAKYNKPNNDSNNLHHQKNDENISAIIKTKTKPKFKFNVNSQSGALLDNFKNIPQESVKDNSNFTTHSFASKAAEHGGIATKKTLSLKGKLKLKTSDKEHKDDNK